MATITLAYVTQFKDRHGKTRFRFRKKGCAPAMLHGEPGSDRFMADYAQAMARAASVEPIGSSRTIPGSLSALIVAYRESAEWRLLAPSTRRMRFNILEKFRADRGPSGGAPYGDRPIAALEREVLLRIRDRRASTPHQANKLIRVLHSLFSFAVERKMMRHNPAAGIRALKIKSDGFHTWSADQIATFEARHPEGSDARLALALLNYTGQRRADVVRMGRQHIRGDYIEVRQEKTGTTLSIPITDPLRRALDAVPKDRMTFLTTGAGRPYSPAYFGNVFRKWCDQAGLPPECRAHGIRKAVATRIADAGHGAHAIAAVTGHRRLQDVAHYTRAADQMRLANGTRSALAGTKEEPIDGKPEAILGKLRRNTLKRKD